MSPATPPVFDDVFVLPLESRRLLFSPRRKVWALLNAAAVKLLCRSDRSDSSAMTPPPNSRP